MASTDISYPKAAGEVITSSDMNKILRAIGSSDADLLDSLRLDIKTDKVELKTQSADPTGGELREGLLWYLGTDDSLRYRAAAATKILANLEDDQTLSGKKTFSHADGIATDKVSERTSANGVSVDGVLHKDSFTEYDEIVTPATPAANKVRTYAKDVNGVAKLAYKDDAGVENIMYGSEFHKFLNDSVHIFEGELFNIKFISNSGSLSDPIALNGYPAGDTSATTAPRFPVFSAALATDPGPQGTLDTGRIIEGVATIRMNGDPTTASTDQLTGIFGLTGENVSSYGNPPTVGSTSNTTNRRIIVGVDNTGSIRVITCDGTAVTNTSTGLTASTGEEIKIHIKWTVGTNVQVIISGTTTTVTTNLMTRWSGMFVSGDSSRSSAELPSQFLGGYYRNTP